MASGKGIRAGRAYVELGVNDKLSRGLKRAERRLKAFGAGVRQVGMRVAALGGAMTAALVGAAKVFSSMGDEVAKMAKRTGMSVEALSELRFVASQTGIEFAAFEKGVKTMQRSIYDLGRGLSTQVDAFADLGLAFKDIDGLLPEEQFKLIAEAISKIEDPTRRAAIAASLLGRAGTRLLPMFKDGAAGIERLQKEARRLGLTMSGEDAKAAEVLTDKMDALGKVIKMGIFRIGAALAPILGDLADKMSDVAAKATKWISRNRGLIVTALKVSAAVLGIGIALIGLGAIISGLGSIFGLLAMAVSAASAAVGIFGAVLAAVVSPIGLAITAIVALGAYVVYATGAAGKALAWLGEKFTLLKGDALKAYGGIVDALATGDIGLAASIMWKTLKLWWVRGVNWLKGIWLPFKYWFLDIGYKAFYGLLKIWEEVWNLLKASWIEATSMFSKLWIIHINLIQRAWTWLKNLIGPALDFILKRLKAALAFAASIAKAVAGIVIKVASVSFEGGKAIGSKAIDEAKKNAAKLKDFLIDEKTQNEIDAVEKKRISRHEENVKRHNDRLLKIQKDKNRDLAGLKDKRTKEEQSAIDDLAKAEKDLADAVEEARRKRMAHEARGEDGPPTPGVPPNLKDMVGALDGVLDRAAKITIGAKGTFNASAILGLQAGGPAERTAKAADQIVRNTKKIVENTKTPLAFA